MRISMAPALKVLPIRADAPARDDPPKLAARLRDVGQATHAFALALDDAGLTPRLGESPVPLQSARARRTNPKQSVTDILLACEALATITGPQSLATGDTGRVHDEARRLARVLRALAEVAALADDDTPDASVAAADDASNSDSAPLPLLAILRADPVRSALARLADLLADLAAVERAQPGRDRWTLRIGTRILIPLSIVLITVALILFFAGGIVFATGAVAISPRGVVFSNPIDNTTPEQADQRPTVTAGHATATPATRATPGATSGGKTGAGSRTGGSPGSAPTATPAGGSPGSAAPTPTRAPPPPATPSPPVVSVTPTTMAACQNKSESFEISYTSGQGTLNWTATVSAGGIQVSLNGTTGWTSQVSGTLQPLTRAKVFVLSPTGASGAVTVTFSAGLPNRTVTIDNSACTAGPAPDTRHDHSAESEPRSAPTSGTSGTSGSPVQEDSSSGHT